MPETSQYRCTGCRRAIGPMFDEDGCTPRMFICPHTRKGATAEPFYPWQRDAVAARDDRNDHDALHALRYGPLGNPN